MLKLIVMVMIMVKEVLEILRGLLVMMKKLEMMMMSILRMMMTLTDTETLINEFLYDFYSFLVTVIIFGQSCIDLYEK